LQLDALGDSILPAWPPLYCQQWQVPFDTPQTELEVLARIGHRKPQQMELWEHADAFPVNAVHASVAWVWLCVPVELQS
jgi:hypothetical protein